MQPDRWAITDSLIGIHCAALTEPDFATFAAHGGSMVWSLLSNLLLYGKTASLGAALAAGVPVALGSDWAPSGSKNLLGELKVARLAVPGAGAHPTAKDLVAMATSTPAQMLGWGDVLGTVEPGKRADLIGVHGTTGDPYEALLDATEADIDLVIIDGVTRAGAAALMSDLGLGGEQVSVAGQARILNLAQPDADPTVAAVSVADALGRLREALESLPDAAVRPGPATPQNLAGRALLAVWRRGARQRHDPAPPLTAIDDPAYYETLAGETNLPDNIKTGLAALAPA
jgi:5-methylthioadenosine/S-adenosylhomocysteine deaminase